jgi:hypothetical protein
MGGGGVDPESQTLLGHIENVFFEVGGLVDVLQKLPSLKDGQQEEVIGCGPIVIAKPLILASATKKGLVDVIFLGGISHMSHVRPKNTSSVK